MTTQLIPVFLFPSSPARSPANPFNFATLAIYILYLEVGKVFAAWITERIKEYGFVKGQDYIEVFSKKEKNLQEGGEVFSKSGKNSKGGRPTIDYHLTLDMAKELSMVERDEKGRQARRYFIGCERRLIAKLQEKHPPLALQGPPISNKQYQELRRRVESIADRFHHESAALFAVWKRLKQQLNVPSRNIPKAQFETALVLLGAMAISLLAGGCWWTRPSTAPVSCSGRRTAST